MAGSDTAVIPANTAASIAQVCYYAPPSYTITVTKSGTGSGTVTSSPAGINCGGDCTENYADSTIVTLTATHDAVSTFAGWSGDADCSDGVVIMDADKACTATFNVACGGLTATIVGASGDDALKGTGGNDVIHGLGGNDTIYGLGGQDTICGGEGNDALYGGYGNDRLLGQPGSDAIDGGAGTDTCNGGLGTDSAVNCETVIGVP